MDIHALIIEQLNWDGSLKSFAFQAQSSLGPMWVSFPDAFEETSGPFNFLDNDYSNLFESKMTNCRNARLTEKRFYNQNGNFYFLTTWNEIPTKKQQLTYYSLYLPEYAVPTEIKIFDTYSQHREFNKVVYRDDKKFKYIIYLECRSNFGLFNFKLKATFHKDDVNFLQTKFMDEKTIDFYERPMDEHWHYLLAESDAKKVEDFFNQPNMTNMDRRVIRKDIIELIEKNLYNNVDIAPIIEKYSAGKDIEDQAAVRVAIVGILRELREEGDITFSDSNISITSRQGGVFHNSSGLIRSTNKYEKEKEKQYSSLYIGGNMTGNINTGKVHGNLHQENTGSTTITADKEAELKSYGVEQAQVDELKTIVSTSPDKATLTSKAMKWLGSVLASIAARGLYENIPAITDFIHKLTA